MTLINTVALVEAQKGRLQMKANKGLFRKIRINDVLARARMCLHAMMEKEENSSKVGFAMWGLNESD